MKLGQQSIYFDRSSRLTGYENNQLVRYFDVRNKAQ